MTTKEPRFVSDVEVELLRHMAHDDYVVQAARVSVRGAEAHAENNEGLINYLMRERHGSPFEHTAFTFRVTAPIFVLREHMRHRIGVSYNEESGRYKELEPVFYIPNPYRELVQEGKPGRYVFKPGTHNQYEIVVRSHQRTSVDAYARYRLMLDAGIAKEVARMTLPLNVMSSMIFTCNARSLMAFLSLRTYEPSAAFVSHPMCEIEKVARKYEQVFSGQMPQTYSAFVDNGRVCP